MADAQTVINNIKTAVLDAVQVNYFQFNGRAARPAFWWYALAVFTLQVLLNILGIDALVMLVGLALLLPGLGLMVRRLHDIGLTGWFAIACLIPFVGLLLIIYWGTKPGDQGPNTYGPAPTDPLRSTQG